jgi:general secretion pathway protein D
MFKGKYAEITSGIIVLTLIFCFTGKLFTSAHAADDGKSDMAKENAIKNSYELEADLLAEKARTEFENDNYPKALELYQDAKKVMLANLGQGMHNNKRIQSINEAVVAVYQYWAEDLAVKAEKVEKNGKDPQGDSNEAIEKCGMAIKECDDAIKTLAAVPKMENITKKFEIIRKRLSDLSARLAVRKDSLKYKYETSEKFVDPKHEDRLYNIDVLLEQGKKFYDDRQYDKARDKFEEILVINPYHVKAIQYIKQISGEMYKEGDRRYDLTHRERVVEVEWKYIPPIIPRTLSGSKEITGKEPILKDEGTSSIQKKLNDIVIDHIEFEDVTIPTVVKYLKNRSRELDPEKQGVNILLRLAGSAPAAAPAAAPAEGAAAPPASAGEVPTITMLVDDIPLGDAIRYICRGANLKYRIERFAVVIAAQDIPLDELETRIYPVEKEAFSELGAATTATGGAKGAASGATATPAAGTGAEIETYFRTRGISFPEGAKIVFDSRISRLIATNTPDNLTKIEEIIHELNVVDPQVLIEAKFVEISQHDIDSLGVEWLVSKPASGITNMSKSKMTFEQNDPINRFGTSSAVAQDDTLFNITHHTTQGITYQALVHALNKSSSGDVLSTPRVTTQNGQEATIRMVREEYYPTSWTEATLTQSGAYNTFTPSAPEISDPTEIGVKLTVTPTVDSDRYTISLDISPVVQSFLGWTDYSYDVPVPPSIPPSPTPFIKNVLIMPIFEVRTIETKLVVYDGETIVMGGAIKDDSGFTDDRIPILGDLPLIGALFRSQAQNRLKRNLLIFVTARLVNPDGSPLREREVRGLPPFRR